MMKNRKTWLLVVFLTFIFLILLLFIQVRWLIHTAETEKRHFEQSVKLSLDLTLQQIINDNQLCINIQTCLLDSQCLKVKELRKLEWQKIDSILKSNLQTYGIDCDYDFEVKYMLADPDEEKLKAQQILYSESQQIAYQEGNMKLIIRLPDRKSFITHRIGPLFISSVLLIILVASAFVFTLLTYLREEKRAVLIKNFIHNMAHEFKTPVAVINLALSRIKANLLNPDNEKLLRYTDIIDNEKNKIQKHLTSILDLAYLESPNAIMVREKAELKSIIEEAIAEITPLLEEKNGTIDFSYQCNGSMLECDREHLRNSFLNILDNACKYSNDNFKIQISCKEAENHFIIEISDNGIGISKKIFLTFSKNISGLVLGIFIIPKVMELV
jgi:two-component system, OmpR family, phosphate regulon sensor histidine kinase PhoR